MTWMNYIISWLKSISDYFYNAYLEVFDWTWPFYYLAYPLYSLHSAFAWLAYYCSQFNVWLVWAANELGKILSWTAIKSLIKSWLPDLESAVNWFLNRVSWFTSQIINWWSTTQATVRNWITVAVEGLETLLVAWDSFTKVTFPKWTTELLRIGSELSSFFTDILPTLFNITYAEEWWKGKFSDITKAINSAISPLMPIIESWQAWRAQVAEFFSDPVAWAKAHILEPMIEDFNRGFDRGLKGE